MKEVYFNLKTIDKEAQKFLDAMVDFQKKHQWVLEEKSCALVILDMQRYFLEESSHAHIPSAKAIVPKIRKLQQAFLNLNLPVIQTKHINKTEDSGQMRWWWNELITEDNPLSSIVDVLRDKRITVIKKTQYDAFYQTDLEKILKDNGVKRLLVTGVMTNLCCETTARSAFVRGFEVFIPVDATAAYNRQFHLSSLINLSYGFAIPVLTADILFQMEG
jgi:bifunctional isochorismate lyase/aryl carrier protein